MLYLTYKALGGATTMWSPPGKHSKLSILIYHRVSHKPDPLLGGAISAADFDAQMEALSQAFNVLPLSEAVSRLQAERLPARAACVTFDDGYADNAEVAFPILKKYEIPATFFISAGYINGGRMWNDTVIETIRRVEGPVLDLTEIGLDHYLVDSVGQRLQTIKRILVALKHLPQPERQEKTDRLAQYAGESLPDNLMMRSNQIRRLHSAGMEIGGHTVSHPILKKLDSASARAEIAVGKEILEGMIGGNLRVFAYPNGRPDYDYGAEHVAMVKSLGFIGAVSTAWGVARAGSDVYQLPRFTPWDRSPLRFVLRLMRNQFRTSPVLAA